jgi:TetR/AcrR family transcriptional regulator, mexCD-oprJ operon repressor
MSHSAKVKLPSETRVSQLPSIGPEEPAPRPALQERVASAILDAAARVLVHDGAHASMADVAAAAGVARATVYRYFPNRQALLEAVTEVGVREARSRLAAARIEAVSVDEGVRRAVRALVETGDYVIVLARERPHGPSTAFAAGLIRPLRDLLDRAQQQGEIRADVASAWLAESLVGLVSAALVSEPALGREDTIATISELFLEGARQRPAAVSARS